MATASTQHERLQLNITPEQRALFQRAAELQRRTLEDFIVSSLEAEAEATIRAHDDFVIRVSPEAYEQFIKALDDPTPPNEHLRKAARDYRAWIANVHRE